VNKEPHPHSIDYHLGRSRAQLACGPKKLPLLVKRKDPLALSAGHLIMTMSIVKANNVIIL
jgi:hypothetical protein